MEASSDTRREITRVDRKKATEGSSRALPGLQGSLLEFLDM